ncbi:MAG: tetratricopeptide repeat protein [Desulfobacteraceae bacterium]|nr:MAG: tetratricopeptide repeat protein [Desulfobacteraceae bacterium]
MKLRLPRIGPNVSTLSTVFLLLFVLLRPACSEDAVTWNNQGIEHLKAGDHAAAIRAFSKAIETDPRMAPGWYYRGQAHARSAQYGKAVADFGRAIELDPDHYRAYLARADARVDSGDDRSALSDYSRCIRIRPQDPEPYSGRAYVYGRLRRNEEAVEDYSRALRIDPNRVIDLLNRAVTYHSMKLLEKAEADYDAVVRLQPENGRAYFYRARLHEERGRSREALNDATRAVELDPGNKEYVDKLASLRAEVAPSSSSRPVILPAPSPETPETLSPRDSKGGKRHPSLARFLFEQALRDWEKYLQTERAPFFQRALFHVDSAVNIEPEESEYRFLQGMLLSSMKNDPEAMIRATDSLIRTVELDPGHGRAQLLLAQILQEQGSFFSAAQQYRFLVERDPNMVTGVVTAPLAACYVASGQTDEGIEFFAVLVERYPDSASARTCLAVLLKSGRRTKEAVDTLSILVEKKLGTKEEQEHAGRLLGSWRKEGRS